MNKNFIKDIDRVFFFSIIKKIIIKLSIFYKIFFFNRFVKKMLNKTELKNISLFNNF